MSQEFPNIEPPVFNIHRTLSPRHGYFERLYYSRKRHDVYKTYLWAPWIIEYMLKKNGFSKAEVKPYMDPHSMAQTYLHTAQFDANSLTSRYSSEWTKLGGT